MVSTTTRPADDAVSSTRSWRSSLMPIDAAQVDDGLVDRIAACDDTVRARLQHRLGCALDAGVCDATTLHTIVDTVTATA